MEGQSLTLVSIDQLKPALSDIIRAELKEYFSEDHKKPDQTEFLTRKQTAAFLGISLPTLLEWTKAGLISGYRISSRIRYKRAEIENSLKQIQSIKHGRQ